MPGVTFCGCLHFGDYETDGERVRIDVRHGAVMPGCQKVRDWRPALMWTEPLLAENAGKDIEEIGRAFAERRAPAIAAMSGLEGERFEAWLMPVTSFSFSYLLISVSDAEAAA